MLTVATPISLYAQCRVISHFWKNLIDNALVDIPTHKKDIKIFIIWKRKKKAQFPPECDVVIDVIIEPLSRKQSISGLQSNMYIKKSCVKSVVYIYVFSDCP